MNLRQAMIKIARVLRDNLFQRRVLSRSGSLEFNRLAKYKTSRNIFSRKLDTSGKLYNFIILVDCSSSMHRGRYIGAMKAAKNIAKLLRHVAHIEFRLFNQVERKMSVDEMLAIDPDDFWSDIIASSNVGGKLLEGNRHLVPSNSPGCEHVLTSYVKDITKTGREIWGEKFIELSSMNRGSHSTAGGTTEIYNLVSARKDIRKREGKNVVLILHDGDPNFPGGICGQGFYSAGQLTTKHTYSTYKDDIKKIEKDVELVSFGIDTQAPSKIFSNFVYIDDPDDIYKNIVLLFERLITS